jgi:YVTN family beta-propeller protein
MRVSTLPPVNRTPARRFVAAGLAALVAFVLAPTIVGAAQASAPINTIAVGSSPYFTKFTPDGTKAYVTNNGAGSVSVIDVLATPPASIATITVGTAPADLAITRDGTEVWVPNFSSNSVSVISTATNTVTATISMPASTGPWSVTFGKDGTKAYVSNYTGNSVSVYTVSTRALVTTIPVADFAEGGVVTADGADLYVAGTNTDRLIRISTATNTVVTTYPLGDFPLQLALSPVGNEIWVASNNGVGTSVVSVFDLATHSVSATVDTPAGQTDIAFSPDGSTAYVATDQGHLVNTIDWATETVTSNIPLTGTPRGVDVSPNGGYIYVAVQGDNSVADIGLLVNRTSGADRYAVANQIAASAFPNPGDATVVYVATGLNYPDALSAGPVAAKDDGPLLLTDKDVLPPSVQTEIETLSPSKIYVVGGPNSVSDAVYTTLATLAPQIERLQGATRYEASRNIVSHGFPSGAPGVYITTGRNFPDALSAGAAGAHLGIPVLLVDGMASSLDQPTLDLIASLNVAPGFKVKIAGGPNSVSTGIETQLTGLYTTTRLSGATRFEASEAINLDAYPFVTTATYRTNVVDRVFLATGYKFPDALAGSVWAGQQGAPLFVVQTDCIPTGTSATIDAMSVSTVELLGGTASLTSNVANLIPC